MYDVYCLQNRPAPRAHVLIKTRRRSAPCGGGRIYAVYPAGNLPSANKKFAVYPVRNLPSASETLADGKRFICRRQTENLQSASTPLAIGKIHV
ncbi:MAG TPA: hypothetical protein IAA30_03695 [Candidatus Treponema faecavium]|nr:hypothetical protein [Candidatus Treponema faecavium]